MIKIINAEGQVLETVETKKAAAEFISAEIADDDLAVSTLVKKIGEAIKNESTLYDITFKEEMEEMTEEQNSMVNEEIESVEEITEEEFAERNEEMKQEDAELLQDLKDQGVLVEGSEEIVEEIIEENKNDVTETEEEDKPNKRKIGKGIIAYKNGEEFERFPSIKACVQHFKDLMGLPHMPFTPVMKSVRQDVDWNEYSFKHEHEEDLHIPESMKNQEKIEKEKAVKDEQPKDQVEEIEEVIEEIPEDEVV